MSKDNEMRLFNAARQLKVVTRNFEMKTDDASIDQGEAWSEFWEVAERLQWLLSIDLLKPQRLLRGNCFNNKRSAASLCEMLKYALAPSATGA